jgi:tetratricopeptide (TPR) repeat protein
MAKKDYERAVLEFRNAAQVLPNSAEPPYQSALAYFDSGDYRRGIAFLLHAAELDPHHTGAQLKLEELRAGEGPGDLGADLLEIADRRLKTILDAQPGDPNASHTPLADLERAFKRNPRNPDIQSHLVGAYMREKRFPEAERTLDSILRLNEGRRTSRSRIAFIMQVVTNFFDPTTDAIGKENVEEDDSAAAQGREEKQEDEKRQNRADAQVLVMRGQLFLATVRAREAEQDLIRALSLDPHEALPHYLLSKVHQVHGAEFTRRQELTEAVELEEGWLQARLELAAARTESGAADAALDLLDRAPQSQQNDVGLIAARNWALLALDDRIALRKSLERGMAIQKMREFLLQEGYLRLRMNDPTNARKSLELALQSDPPDLRSVDALAESYWREKNPTLALVTMHGYVSRYPRSAGLQYLLGTWLLRLNRPEEAKAAFQAAIQARPGFLAALEKLADLDIRQGNLDSARQTIGLIASSPGGHSSAELALGVIEERRGGDPQSAIAHYRKVLQESPDNAVALNNLAYHLAGDPSHANEALDLALRLKKLAPNSASVDDTLGWAYYNNGSYDLAVHYLQAALSKQTKPSREYRLAMAFFKAGSREKSRAALRDAMKQDPAAPEAATARQLIDGSSSTGK